MPANTPRARPRWNQLAMSGVQITERARVCGVLSRTVRRAEAQASGATPCCTSPSSSTGSPEAAVSRSVLMGAGRAWITRAVGRIHRHGGAGMAIGRGVMAGAAMVGVCAGALRAAEDCDCGDEDTPAASSPMIGSASTLPKAVPGERVSLDLFVMSLCPYGMEAERALLPLARHLADHVELRIHYIADEVGDSTARTESRLPTAAQIADLPEASPVRPGCSGKREARGTGPFASLHGQEEVDESCRQLVLGKDSEERLHAYLLCRSLGGPEGDWRTCARDVGVDPQELQEQALGTWARQLFRENIRLANQLDISLSPTLLIGGEEYVRQIGPFAVGRAVCQRLPRPDFCEDWPACGADGDCDEVPGVVSLCFDPDTPKARCEYAEPVPFQLTLLFTDQCRACDVEEFLSSTVRLFPGAQLERVALESPPGQLLAREYGVEHLPAYILGTGFSRTARFARVQHLLMERGDAFVVRPRVNETTYWYQRPYRAGQLDVFLPGDPLSRDRDLEQQILRLWSPTSNEHPDVRFHYLPPAGEDLTPEAVMADALSIPRDAMSILVENRLVRRRTQPLELPQLWRENRTR